MADETPYEIMGGEQSVRALADRFYDLIEQDPRFAGLRSIHEENLTAIRANLTSFLSGWLGGPRDRFGPGKCVMSLHSRLAIAAHWRGNGLTPCSRPSASLHSSAPVQCRYAFFSIERNCR